MKNKLIVIAFLGVLGLLNFHLTASAQPTVTTLAASDVTVTNATLHGTVNPNGAATTAYYQYGLTTNYGNIGGVKVFSAVNATFVLPGLVVDSLRGAAGADWEAFGDAHNWSSIASSADGTRLAAAILDDPSGLTVGRIWISTNSGVTWTQTSAPDTYWRSIASSADGTRLVAGTANGWIWTSTNSGLTWTQTTAPTNDWYSIASSADGIRLAAGSREGGIWTSTNSGLTWAQTTAPAAFWTSIASSAGGTKLAATALNLGGIWTSTNGGVTWTQTSAPGTIWTCIASSADGARLAAVHGTFFLGDPGGIWTSTNSGLTWTQTSAPDQYWYSIASSADGTRLAAGGDIHSIWTSTNSGLTWTPSSTLADDWISIASSADGTLLAAAPDDGSILISTGAANGLTPGTAYHYRVVGFNNAGISLGSDLTFTTSPAAPLASTLAASDVFATSATLNGAVNPSGTATTAYFRYGLTTNYGSFSATNSLPATNVTLAVSNLISGLSPGATYHFRLVANNSAGSAFGTNRTFGPSSTHVFTGAGPGLGLDLQGNFLYAVNVGSNGAPGLIGDANFTADNVPGVTITAPGNTLKTINAWANPNFGATTDAVRLAQAMSSIRWTSVPGILTVNLDGLQVGRSYQLQLLFIESSSDRVFDVKVNGTTIVPAFRLLDYGPWGTGIVIPCVFTATNTNALIQLGGGTGGNDNNPILSALTLEALVPAVTTLAASGVTGANALLNGTVNPNGAPTAAYFQYGLTTNYGSYSATNSLPATNATIAVSNLITGLEPATTYHFRLVASNSTGTTFGADRTFGLISTHVFTGAEPGQGLDLQGSFLYAVNVGSNGAPGLIGDANFTADNVPGVTITAPGNTLNTLDTWANPNFGVTTNALRLAQAMSSIRWTAVPGILTVNLAGLQVGRSYQLQLLFIESCCDRVFDVKVNGTTVVPAFRPLDYGPSGTAIVIQCFFTATGTSALIQLGGGSGGSENNPTVSAFTLEVLSPSQSVNFNLKGSLQSSGSAFQLSFTNLSGLAFTVLGTTNLGLPLSNWTVLGAPTETPPGQYQFTDSQTTNNPRRFYRVRSP